MPFMHKLSRRCLISKADLTHAAWPGVRLMPMRHTNHSPKIAIGIETTKIMGADYGLKFNDLNSAAVGYNGRHASDVGA
jgi:hypothetical protein